MRRQCQSATQGSSGSERLLFAVLLLFLCLTPGQGAAKVATLVIEAETGEILLRANETARAYPASLTKMMTLYLVFDALASGSINFNRDIVTSKLAARQPASRLGLKPGETITVREATLSLVTKSANDAAMVLAEAIGGSERRFVRQMNIKARKLGMMRTRFRNPTGLYHSAQVSTALDMAILARALWRNHPQRFSLFATRNFRYGGRTYRNHNRLLDSYAGVDGIKTGYLRASGYNLAASVERDGRRLIGIVLGDGTGKARDQRMVGLFDRAFARVSTQQAAAKGGNSGWAIQLGSYHRLASARLAFTRAARRAPNLLARARTVIVPILGKHGVRYRARLVGLSSAFAQSLCQKLDKGGMPCLALEPA
jgi:D-alanyl-D-alanine carboxypeptidase